MDKLRMQSSNGVEDNIAKIAQLFPDCVTETVDERSGQPKHLIDFEKLKQNLSDSVISERAERYQFTWPDKSKAILLANSPINATLRPCREDSVDFDNTQNLYIEGDNLDVLKCLKETYLHKVKMIYIDPPYNTGNDFVYEDDFAQSSEEYLANSGQFDEQGNRMFTNAESNGRFHTDWLNMIYPRLKVARDLLTDDGVIFISIDDTEVDNIRKICDEIFKAFDGFKKKYGNDWETIHKAAQQWYKQFSEANPIYNSKHYSWMDERGVYFPDNISGPNFGQYRYDVIHPITHKVVKQPASGWRYPEETLKQRISQGLVHFGKDETTVPNNKTYLENTRTQSLTSIKYKDGRVASKMLTSLMGANVFNNPKDTSILLTLMKAIGVKESEIILDFFSGSSSTAHACMELGADGNKAKFIMVQIQENLDKTLEHSTGGAKTILKNAIKLCDELHVPHLLTELGKERIRRAGKKIKEESPLTTKDLDTGFRVLKLDSTNMQDIYYSPKDISQADLFSQVDNVKPDRTGEDLLFQVMLELGATLDSKIETTTVAGKTIYNVAEGYLVACFDPDVTDEVVKAIAQMLPAYAVLRDTSMKDDSTATNFEQIFKTYSPDTVTKIL